ncbi:MAG: peptidylprolyl isomerase [Helicobacteraceae bacterium]|nr:peptidylprolyl isomerase [Helicobacteraceae bacterium]
MYKLLVLAIFTLFSASAQANNGKGPIVVLETTKGNIEIQLFEDKAPKTVENFVTLVKRGYYNGIIFHRIIKNFMIQGGDPSGTGRGGESAKGGKFNDEFNPSLDFDNKGVLAMANAGPNTNGSQFFITTVPTSHLNGHHTIFGQVIKGMDVVDDLENVRVDRRSKPVKTEKIIKATIKK